MLMVKFEVRRVPSKAKLMKVNVIDRCGSLEQKNATILVNTSRKVEKKTLASRNARE